MFLSSLAAQLGFPVVPSYLVSSAEVGIGACAPLWSHWAVAILQVTPGAVDEVSVTSIHPGSLKYSHLSLKDFAS